MEQQPNYKTNTHYKLDSGYEVIHIIKLALTREEFAGFCKGNILKYTLRAGKKEGEDKLKDLKKATDYLYWLGGNDEKE